MFRNLTIQASLTLVMLAFVTILLMVIGVGVGSLKLSNDALQKMFGDDTQALTALKTSSEQLLQARVAMGSYQALYGLGEPEPALLDSAAQSIKESDRQFALYLTHRSDDSVEIGQAAQLQTKRAKLVKEALQPAFEALGNSDFIGFKTLQGKDTAALSSDYQASLMALEGTLAMHEAARYDTAQQRFRWMLEVLGGAGLAVLLIGWLARRALVAAIVLPVAQAISHFKKIAAGDLTEHIVAGRRNEMGALLDALRHMQGELARTVQTVRTSTESINVGAREIAVGNSDLSQRTEQQAASLERTANSMDQLTSTVRQNADHAHQANTLAVHASSTAVRGGEVVSQVVATMHGIAGHSKKIGEIIAVIDGIAFQTNILALNAAVEAARAGDQGRGFAVVAGEVRTLAQRSAAAAREIKQLIGDSVSQIDAGAVLVERAGVTIAEVVQAVQSVAHIMADISTAAGEQRRGIEQVSQVVTQMDASTQQNAALVEQAAAAAQSLESQADTLRRAVEVFLLVPELYAA